MEHKPEVTVDKLPEGMTPPDREMIKGKLKDFPNVPHGRPSATKKHDFSDRPVWDGKEPGKVDPPERGNS